MSAEIDYQMQRRLANEKYKEARKSDEIRRREKKEARLAEMSEADRRRFEEYQTTTAKTYGRGLGFLAFLGIGTILIVIGVMLSDAVDLSLGSYIPIAIAVSLIMAVVCVFLANAPARAEKSRKCAIATRPAIKEYLDFCKAVDKEESEELKAARAEFEEADRAFFYHRFADTVMIFAPATRTNDSFSLYKSVSVYIDGVVYCEQLKSGVTKVKVNPGYHNFRFVERLSAKSADGTPDRVREYTCQVEMTSEGPVGIFLGGKTGYSVIQHLSPEKYESWSS